MMKIVSELSELSERLKKAEKYLEVLEEPTHRERAYAVWQAWEKKYTAAHGVSLRIENGINDLTQNMNTLEPEEMESWCAEFGRLLSMRAPAETLLKRYRYTADDKKRKWELEPRIRGEK